MTRGATTSSKMTLSLPARFQQNWLQNGAPTLSIEALCVMTFSIVALNIKAYFATFSITNLPLC